jgi:hypothetical protein
MPKKIKPTSGITTPILAERGSLVRLDDVAYDLVDGGTRIRKFVIVKGATEPVTLAQMQAQRATLVQQIAVLDADIKAAIGLSIVK